MRLSALAIIGTTFAAAAGICYTAAGFVVSGIESTSERSVRNALDDATLSWAEVQANGLQVFLSGRAPTEAERFKAVSTAGTVVDTARVIDQMTVKDTGSLTPPRFSIEILRNDRGISLIGLIPAATDRAVLVNTLASLTGEGQVADLLESADYPAPDTWDVTLSYAIDALKSLPRAKLSIQSGQLSIKAMSDSAEEKRRLETDLARRTPSGVRLAMQI
ncbi:MAG: BON domain-containing protein, partial [Rhodobacteraceae bacterium]|nr:BON domain-containing protein [Paracoccaceae bacterium]